ncbi:hypothetical protein FQN51_001169 [Onygenales sp. PD_10]|nr:hypothetical protein FQN51_001169 [Onygenales sp. PD_10]
METPGEPPPDPERFLGYQLQMVAQEEPLSQPFDAIPECDMQDVSTDPSDLGSTGSSNTDTSGCTSPDAYVETESSISETSGPEKAPVPEDDAANILIDYPPEILRGKYSSMPGKKPKPGLNRSLPPISKIEDIFDDISVNAERNGFDNFLKHLGSRHLRVATMCSGTEAPLLALEMVMDRFKRIFGKTFNMHHLFSAEIDPFKQSYIQRNFSPDIIFRDVNELVADEATTAFGSLREVPLNLDLLVVGFSCVDFSNLNLYRKALDEMGESGHTFFSVLRYVQRCRPPLVVLENVCGAPWSHIRDTFKEMDYHAYHIKIDTKNYYLPQTRERGYMLCIDQTRLATEPPGDPKSSIFAKMMKLFERPASSPVTQFLLKNDDPRLQDAIDDISMNPVRDRQAVDWTRYKARHLRYRMREGLGDKRPLTHWQDNGTCQMPDFYWHGWSKAQTERVWDTLDVNYLRSIIRGYDISFKSRIIDLSQGLDRELDQRASGVAGCLTPRGQHFVTSRGGPLLGIEALALQGIPIDRLLLSNDGQRDLHDLAGNAMSSTVVGAAIMSALIIGYEALAPDQAAQGIRRQKEQQKPQIPLVDEQTIPMVMITADEANMLSPSELLKAAMQSSRMCICEGKILTKRTDMLECCKCGFTACKSCGRNPIHEYQPIPKEKLIERICAVDFENQLKQQLPMRVQINGLTIAMFQELREDYMSTDAMAAWDDYVQVLLPALGEELRFQGTTRHTSWTVTYEGSRSVLKLTSSSGRLLWALYIAPPKKEPSNSPLREILRSPIACMMPSGDNLLNGVWHINSPISSYFDITVSGSGNLVPSNGAKAGLKHPHHINGQVWNQINVSGSDAAMANLEFDIRGDYELLQDCGAASGSLHRKITSTSESPIYFFLDPTEIGPSEFDSWVFALDHDRLDIGESRNTIAEVRPSWDAAEISQYPKSVRCWFRKRAACEQISLGVYLPSAPTIYRTPDSEALLRINMSSCLESYMPLLTCSVPASGPELSWESGIWRASNLIESPTVLKNLSWLLQQASSVTQFSNWKNIDLDYEECNKECLVCAPRKPRLMWALDEKDRVYAYENTEDAAIYERNIKKRPASFLGFTKIDDESIAHVKLCLNVVTLLHQARGKLGKKDNLSLQWRLCVDNIGFVRQRLPTLQERNNKDDNESAQPPGFKSFPLRPEQLRSLTWMKKQEDDNTQPFEEEEVVEAMLPIVNWRAEAKATTSHTVRGGILGDDVGYGKTAITLGLIDSQYAKDSTNVPESVDGAIPIKATLIVVPQHLIDQWSREVTKFLGKKYNILEIKSISASRSLTIRRFEDADIILLSTSVVRGSSYYDKMELFGATPEVPKGEGRIFDEWLHDTMVAVREHVDLLLTKGPDAVLQNIITKETNLKNSGGYSRFKPSRRLKGQKFQEYLKKLKERLQQDKGNKGGADKQVAEASLNDMPNPSAQDRKRKRVENEGNEELHAVTNDASQSKRPKAKPKAASKEPGTEADKTFQLQKSQNDWRNLQSPLIHMFEFNRIVIDEFTYSKDRNYSSVLAIPARSKWILSGTPPLNDFADVKSFSPFLGITLGVDDDERGKTENERLRTLQREQTDAEQFQPFITRHSAAWHRRRHEVAQEFLDRFMRKNSPGIDEIPWTEHICAVTLAPRERAAYLELFMQLMSQNLKLRRNGRGLYDTSAISRNDAILGNSSGPEEALLKCCSLFVPLEKVMGKRLIEKIATTGTVIDDSSSATGSETGESLWSHDERSSGVSELGDSPEPVSGKETQKEKEVFTRDQQLDDLGMDIIKKLRHAFWLESNIEGPTHFGTLIKHLQANGAGDLVVTNCFQKAIASVLATRTPDDGKYYYQTTQEKNRPPYPVTPAEFLSDLNHCTDTLRRLIDEALIRVRAARLFVVVRSYQEPRPDDVFACASCFNRLSDPTSLTILGECGHAFCAPCTELAKIQGKCRLPACGGGAEGYRMIRYSDVAFTAGSHSPDENKWEEYGSTKFLDLINLLQDTTRIPADDQVLLFIQFEDLMTAASAALRRAGIPHLTVGGSDRAAASKQLADFQMGRERVRSRVAVLQLGDVTAAGLNLQTANHIIFLHPLSVKSQYDYNAGMAQAIGRARRYGQLKHVHVYHFLALKTVEVNVFETRRGERVVRWVGGGDGDGDGDGDGEFGVVGRDGDEKDGKGALEAEGGWRGVGLDGSNGDGE